MKAYLVEIQCITNMHVGNGDVNYNIIDNEVERDPITKYPMINASGVKGALREYFKEKVAEDELNLFFGKGADTINSQGKVKILGADMVAIPVRASKGDQPYYLVSTDYALNRMNELAEIFIGRELSADIQENTKMAEAEGYRLNRQYCIGSRKIYLMKHEEFMSVDLPVLARNKLNNGISENLWYEEIVPHDSLFIFPIVAEDEDILNRFIKVIEGQIVQFGGNASIGYGLCKVTVHRGGRL